MNQLEFLKEIQQEIDKSGNKSLAQMLDNVLTRQAVKNTYTIGFMGDDLVGKSTIINYILGEKILPATVIPSSAEITIKYGIETAVYDESGSVIEGTTLSQLVEEKDVLSISTNNDYLKENSLEIKEFHGLLSKSKLSDMDLMADVYKCDAVVLVMTAEHLLSESECLFIKNYIKYVGSSHILLVVNKLSSVAENDIAHILDYVKKQIAAKFADVKWSIYMPENNYKNLMAEYADIELKKEIERLFVSNKEENDLAVRNTLVYIKNQLVTQQKEMEEIEGKSVAELEKKKEENAKQRELEEASIEEALIEFQQKRNETIEAVDLFIKNQFEQIFSKVNTGYANAADKHFWYENELDRLWNNLVLTVASSVDDYATAEIIKDIDWLNNLLNTKLGVPTLSVDIPDNSLQDSYKMIPYGTYKKYAPIGIGGGVILGYCLFRIIGAAIGLGGGLLAYSYIGLKDTSQNEEIQRKLGSKIRDISSDTRKLSRKDLEKIYADVLTEFQHESSEIIKAKYKFEMVKDSNYKEQSQRLGELINKIEEV